MTEYTPEQLAAIQELRARLLQASPGLVEMGQAARDYFKALMDAPTWKVVESPQPSEMTEEPDRDLWSVGPPKIRYFDKEGNEVPQL